jgi:pimeloyl-ACP methyl ester carboxylesterase
MLPGGPGFSAAYMRGTAELLAGTFESYLVDPHGSGESTAPSETAAYSPEGHARFYERVRSALGLPAVTVLGHSFGATTALTYAALHPDSVDRCIAVAPFGIGTLTEDAEGQTASDEMARMLARHETATWYAHARAVWESWTELVLAADDASQTDEMMRAVLPLYTAHPDRSDVASALADFGRHLRSDLPALKAWEGGLYQRIDLRPLLGRVTVPTLVLAGELDIICGPAQAVPISAAMPEATLVLIPDCGHMPSIEAPELFRSEVLDWLAAA